MPIVEVDLTAESQSESPEVSVIGGRRANHNSRRDKFCQAERNKGESLDNLTKLFDRSLLAEVITEDPWMNRLRRVIERNNRHSFELMGPYTNPLWHQLSVVDDCILLDNRSVGDHRGCGLVERTIQTIMRRLGFMLLDENVTSIKLCLSTIIRGLR